MGQFSREDCNREVWEGWVRIRQSMNWTRIRWEGDILDIHALAMQREKGKGAEQQLLLRSRFLCDVCDHEA